MFATRYKFLGSLVVSMLLSLYPPNPDNASCEAPLCGNDEFLFAAWNLQQVKLQDLKSMDLISRKEEDPPSTHFEL